MAVAVIMAGLMALVTITSDAVYVVDWQIGRAWGSLLTRTEAHPQSHRLVRRLMELYLWLRPLLALCCLVVLAAAYFAARAGYYHWVTPDQEAFQQAVGRLVATLIVGAIVCMIGVPTWLWVHHWRD
jgi:hypothetical protein